MEGSRTVDDGAQCRPFFLLEDDEDDEECAKGEGTEAKGSSSREEGTSSFCAAASILRLTAVGMPFSCELLQQKRERDERTNATLTGNQSIVLAFRDLEG